MNNRIDIKARIHAHAPALDQEMRDSMWGNIAHKLAPRTEIPSPFMDTLTHRTRTMRMRSVTTLVLVFTLLFGGGTALASDAARPGDLLFPLERAVENTRLLLAVSDKHRGSLEAQFANERILELEDILEEETRFGTVSNTPFTSLKTDAASSAIAIEATVYSDTAIITIEIGDVKHYLQTSARTRDALVAFVHEETGIDAAHINTLLNLSIEDRRSRPKDRGATLTPQGEKRAEVALDAIRTFFDDTQVSAADREVILKHIEGEINALRKNGEARTGRNDDTSNHIDVDTDDTQKRRIEVRDGETRIRIDQENGEVRIRTEREDDTEMNTERNRFDNAEKSDTNEDRDARTDSTEETGAHLYPALDSSEKRDSNDQSDTTSEDSEGDTDTNDDDGDQREHDSEDDSRDRKDNDSDRNDAEDRENDRDEP